MILHRYLASYVFKGAALVLFILVGLSLFFTFISELSDVGKGQYGMSQMFQYLLLKIPTSIVDFMPLAVLLGCMLGLGSLASSSEIIAMQSSGFSVFGLMKSVLLSVFFLALLSLLIADFIVPQSETWAKEIRSGQQGSSISVHSRKGVWIKDDNKIIYIARLFPNGNAENIEVYLLGSDGKLEQTTTAKKAILVDQNWILKQVEVTNFTHKKISVSEHNQQRYEGNLSQKLLQSLSVDPQQMSLSDLYTYMQFLRENNLNDQAESLSFWRKVYAPLSILVMGLLTIPFILGSQRQSNTGQRLMIGILLGLLFVVFNRLLIQLGEQLNLVAFINAFIPTLIFMLITFWLIRRKLAEL